MNDIKKLMKVIELYIFTKMEIIMWVPTKKNIEGFMIEFSKTEPIEDDTDIPKFISIADLLERYLKDLPNKCRSSNI